VNKVKGNASGEIYTIIEELETYYIVLDKHNRRMKIFKEFVTIINE
jgi:hypothetical protein